MVDKAGATKPADKTRAAWDGVAKAKEIGAARTVKVLQAVERLDKLGNARYKFTEQQIDAIFTAIRGRLDRAEAKFRAVLAGKGEKTEEVGFTL